MAAKSFPIQILVLQEKHRDRYIHVPAGELFNVMLKVVQERALEGWYPDVDRMLLDLIRSGDQKAARRFFELRREHEYEGWELEMLEEVLNV